MTNKTIHTKSESWTIVFILKIIILLILFFENADAQVQVNENAKPWVFWYWMQASVSQEGITADLEAMKEAGIGGAYLMPIKGVTNPPLINPPVEQLTPEWWKMILHAIHEADRLGLKLGMHVSDGFALAGGPWITPDLSMQKIVWSEMFVDGEQEFNTVLKQPQTNESYYKDIAVFAFPSVAGSGISTVTHVPKVTSSKPDVNAQFLVEPENKNTFRSEDPCWIQYEFNQPFTCRTITIRTNGNNYQAHRLLIETSDDGKVFYQQGRLESPRHGWQDTDAAVTHVIKPVTAKFFRFLYNKEGSEPGAEDLDAAKWKPSLKIMSLSLSSEPRLNQYEGKTGEVWRVSQRTTADQVPVDLCVQKDKIVNLTGHLNSDDRLSWHVPPGKWTILRMGHTSTGHTNGTGGGGKGLECDKFNPEAIQLQFDRWFGEVVKKAGPELTSRVLKTFHVDSWECGSQNWSPVFQEEFKKRRGYDLMDYLPVMAGIPVQSADVSERFLHDIRQTIADLVHDNFYGTLAKLAHEKGCDVSAESVAPTMTSDGMLQYDLADVPMGEFWLRSPTHDKPNDMSDAISGAHVYGKQIIQAEAFTELRMAWDEHPAMLKTIGDRNYALGINRLVYHVFTHNPWLDRKPGMTLDGVGLYFQRDQTWWKPGKAWVEYAQRCQSLLQQGKPVIDVAVFTGEETPRRSILPYRLVPSLPGIMGKDVVERELNRLKNIGEPLREMPTGVTHSANMADPENWIDPLRGYAYDSFNKDVLLRLAKVNQGQIELPGGIRYNLLVIPKAHPMSLAGNRMTSEVASKLIDLVKAGGTLLINDQPDQSPSLEKFPAGDEEVKQAAHELFDGKFDKLGDDLQVKQLGKGKIIKGIYREESFQPLGIERDCIITDSVGNKTTNIAWTHRASEEQEIYFIANQQNKQREIKLSLRKEGCQPELYDPVTNETRAASDWKVIDHRTVLPLRLEANGSMFILLKKSLSKEQHKGKNWITTKLIQHLEGNWSVAFDKQVGGPPEPVTLEKLMDWSTHLEASIRYYSGAAIYSKSFTWKETWKKNQRVWLDLGHVANIAAVKLNGISCGVAWTQPYRVDISKALKSGENQLVIEVTNTWANRLIGDHALPESQRITQTTAPYRLEGKPLLQAGLLGPVSILIGE